MGITSHTKHRLIKVSILCMVFMFLLSSCPPLVPRSTPYDFPDSTWESLEPYIDFHVTDWDPYNAEIYTLVNGEKVEMLFFCDKNTSTAEFWDPNSREYTSHGSGLTKCYLVVEHKVNKEKIEIKILEDNLYNDEYSSITLYHIE